MRSFGASTADRDASKSRRAFRRPRRAMPLARRSKRIERRDAGHPSPSTLQALRYACTTARRHDQGVRRSAGPVPQHKVIWALSEIPAAPSPRTGPGAGLHAFVVARANGFGGGGGSSRYRKARYLGGRFEPVIRPARFLLLRLRALSALPILPLGSFACTSPM
ncbi:hypothetical protein B0A49_06069 [Cryomyces minteri]|uniref:Uncharacterized protein n=1 Tax=Cryomyces minteri TaxID=331657 RepID=A0A4U0X6W1_9PEZI|nr:hypothetical protein B0A49_06069 [Cryomyces minteri]